MQLWFDANDTGRGWCDTQVLFSKNKSGTDAGQLTIGVDQGTLFAELEGVDATGRLTVFRVEGGDNVSCGDWHNVAFTFGEAGMKLYLDGALVGENAYTGGLQGNHEAIVIGASNADNRNTSGNLSKLTISDLLLRPYRRGFRLWPPAERSAGHGCDAEGRARRE